MPVECRDWVQLMGRVETRPGEEDNRGVTAVLIDLYGTDWSNHVTRDTAVEIQLRLKGKALLKLQKS